MGKLKNLIINNQEVEAQFHRIFNAKNDAQSNPKLKALDPRLSGLEDNDQAWAQYEQEFNDWLDKYEASFGDQHGYLP
jgi:hypothetical protein